MLNGPAPTFKRKNKITPSVHSVTSGRVDINKNNNNNKTSTDHNKNPNDISSPTRRNSLPPYPFVPKEFPPGIYVPKEYQSLKFPYTPPKSPSSSVPKPSLKSPPHDFPPPLTLPDKPLTLPRTMSVPDIHNPDIHIDHDPKPTFPYQKELSDTPTIIYNILWTSKTIKTLDLIMKHINNNKNMKAIGHIVRYYIDNYSTNTDEYNILTVDVPTEDIGRDVMILAYVCEIYLKRDLEANTVITDFMIYQSFPQVISEVVNEVYSYDEWNLNYSETYLVNLVSELSPGSLDNKKNIITCAYYLTRQIIFLDSKYRILEALDTLYLQTQDIDLSVIPSQDKRNIMNILNVDRTIYLRILLLLVATLIKQKTVLDGTWFKSRSRVSNHSQLITYFNDMFVEMLITFSGLFIKSDI